MSNLKDLADLPLLKIWGETVRARRLEGERITFAIVELKPNAVVPEHRSVLAGAERADSLVVNPHKWLFTPFDLSAFYCRRMDVIRAAFDVTPEYLRTSDPETARNLMDTGIQLGRRLRA